MGIFSACLEMRPVKTYTLAHISKGPQTSTVCMDVSKYSQSVVVLKKNDNTHHVIAFLSPPIGYCKTLFGHRVNSDSDLDCFKF